MAIHRDVPGLQVQIVVNGEALHEYENDRAQVADRTVERYVVAHTGGTFEINYTFDESFPGDRPVSMIVTIDGKDMDEPLIRTHELYEPGGHFSRGPIQKVGSTWKVQPYKYAPIDIREHDDQPISEDLKEKLHQAGVITCGFYFLENPRRNRPFVSGKKKMDVLPPVSEKAVKGEALSHHAVLGATEPTEKVEYFDAEYADGGEPFATFHFYYRSMAALKDLHIVERTPDPLELLYNSDDPVSQLNREQLEAIVRRVREVDAQARTKRERSSSETIVGDNDDVGDRRSINDLDLVELRSVDLRAMRRAKRVRQLPTPESEVVVIDQ